MNNHLESGDMAVVIGCREDAINVGKGCVLLKPMTPGSSAPHPVMPATLIIVNVSDVTSWLVLGPSLISSSGEAGFALIDAHHLRPLRGGHALDLQAMSVNA